jgi:hypothetical protein
MSDKKEQKKWRKNPEAILQMQICNILSAFGVFYFSVPNERRNLKDMMRLKKMGLLSGIPDLIILHKGKTFFLELKSEKGTISDNQKIVQLRLCEMGYEVWTAYGYNQAIDILKKWGIIN